MAFDHGANKTLMVVNWRIISTRIHSGEDRHKLKGIFEKLRNPIKRMRIYIFIITGYLEKSKQSSNIFRILDNISSITVFSKSTILDKVGFI